MEIFLVPQEQSLVLKELGFDKKCWGVWVNGRFEPRYKSKNSTFNPNQKLDKRNVDYCTAPTFEQAFDWFREKYNLYLWVYHYKDGFGYSNGKGTVHHKDYMTYEEARLECLKKLIELSKN